MFRLGLLKVPVSDIDRACAFYSVLLDRAPDVRVPEYGWAHFALPDLTLALYVPGKGGGDRPPGGSVDFHLTHPDPEVVLDRLRPLQRDAAMHKNDDGSLSLDCRDPDGNGLRIMACPPD